MDTDNHEWDFQMLVGSIRKVHDELATHVGRAVNLSLTMRNWLIGCHITEYEQRGADRAEYGARLLENLSSHLADGGMKGVAPRSLRQYRQFYLTYPGIWQTPSAKWTMSFLYPSTSLNSQRKRKCNDLLKSRLGKRNCLNNTSIDPKTNSATKGQKGP